MITKLHRAALIHLVDTITEVPFNATLGIPGLTQGGVINIATYFVQKRLPHELTRLDKYRQNHSVVAPHKADNLIHV